MDKASTILIIDDAWDSLLLLTETLTAGGFNARPADSAELALASFKANCPDLILLDIRMPQVDGFEVCRRLKARQETRDIPVIMLTAVNDVEDKIKSFRMGAVDYITKPFQPEELLARVKTHLKISRLSAELAQKARELEEANSTLLIDIARRRQAEAEKQMMAERLQRAEKMEAIGNLAGGVAHELNNMLGVLLGYAEVLLQNTNKIDPRRQWTEKIITSGERAAALVQDLLIMARRGVVLKETNHLNQIVATQLLTSEFQELFSASPHVTVNTEFDRNLRDISVSAIHIGRALANLINNALQATQDVGSVTIRTEGRCLASPLMGYEAVPAGEYAVLSVSDTGKGIPPEDMQHLFEPFYNRKVMKKAAPGLGLAVIWGALKEHDGYIDVTSEPGQGTTFSLYIPVEPVDR